MNDVLKAFLDGCAQGARETPRGFFAPVVALFRWLDRVTDEAMGQVEANHQSRLAKH